MNYALKSFIISSLLMVIVPLKAMEIEPEHKLIKIVNGERGSPPLVIDRALLPSVFCAVALSRMKEGQAGELILDYSSQLFPLLGRILYVLKAFENTSITEDHLVEQSFSTLFATSEFDELVAKNIKELGAQVLDMVDFLGFPKSVGTALKKRLHQAAKVHYLRYKEEIELPGVEPMGFSIDELIQHNLLRDDVLEIYPNNVVDINLTGYMINSVNGIEELMALKGIATHNAFNLNLSDNRLSALSDYCIDFLNNASGLVGLSLAKNQLKILPDAFSVLASRLAFLNLEENDFVALPYDFLSHAPQLRELHLNSNKLKDLPAQFLALAPNLNAVMLDNNSLTVVPPHFLQSSLNIQMVTLNGALIPRRVIQRSPVHVQKAIEAGDKWYKNALAEIRLEGALTIHDLIHLNRLRDTSIQKLANKRVRIDLRNYRLKSVYGIEELLILKGIDPAQIEELEFTNNKLTDITSQFNSFLSALPHLSMVLLGNNPLSVLPEDFLSNMPNLKQLDLRNTQLSRLPANFLADSRTITRVFLTGTQIPIESLQALPGHVQEAIAVGERTIAAFKVNPEKKQDKRIAEESAEGELASKKQKTNE